ncbi:MAG: hypothetical protein KAV87_15650 [Desulfobacteraceae bacterium]|nr:hypothetical protein [Desulfobacteraceae bacterium]
MKTTVWRMSQDSLKSGFQLYRDGASLLGPSRIIHSLLSGLFSDEGIGPKEFAGKSAVNENRLSFSTPTEVALH